MTIQGLAGETEVKPSGQWFYYFPFNQPPGPVTLTATLSDGASQQQDHVVIPRGLTSVPAFQFP